MQRILSHEIHIKFSRIAILKIYVINEPCDTQNLYYNLIDNQSLVFFAVEKGMIENLLSVIIVVDMILPNCEGLKNPKPEKPIVDGSINQFNSTLNPERS